MPYQSINPAAGEPLQKFEEHTDDQMTKALAAADAVYRKSWSMAAYKERAKYIGKAAALMLEQKELLARLATLEMGKRIA
jgi:succinate-semialdehyde dehydrogenase / glutarate-semialdehyde dehydrogenase